MFNNVSLENGKRIGKENMIYMWLLKYIKASTEVICVYTVEVFVFCLFVH